MAVTFVSCLKPNPDYTSAVSGLDIKPEEMSAISAPLTEDDVPQ